MRIDEQIKEKLNELMKIISSADDYISKLEQFSKVLTEKEKTLFDKYPLLDIIRFSFWDLAVLEICKLFNPDEKYGLTKILNIIINNYSKIPWKVNLRKKEFTDLIKQINQKEYLVERLKRIRDNFIAHLDDRKYVDSLAISELRSLVDLSQTVYKKIELGINDSDMIWDFKNDTLDMKMIKNLFKFEALREYIVTNDFKRVQYISTDDLIKILMN